MEIIKGNKKNEEPLPEHIKTLIVVILTSIYNLLPFSLQIIIIIFLIIYLIKWVRKTPKVLKKINAIYKEYAEYEKKKIFNVLDHILKTPVFIFTVIFIQITGNYVKFLCLMFVNQINKNNFLYSFFSGFFTSFIYFFAVLKLFSFNIPRVLFSTCLLFCIIVIVVNFLLSSYRNLCRIYAIYGCFSLILGLLVFLGTTYFSNILSYPINSITKIVIGKPVLTEICMYDRGIFGLYKSSGKGRIIYLNTVYEGDIVNLKEQGQGKKTFAEGVIYEGNFIDGKFNGEGNIIWEDGTMIRGHFINNKLNLKEKILYGSVSMGFSPFGGAIWQLITLHKLELEGKSTVSGIKIW